MRWWGLPLLLSLWFFSTSAPAAVQRFAVIVGNNQGQGQDIRLRYAESDAAKMAQVLRDLGGFEPAEIVLLRAEHADAVRSTLIALNDRIRAAATLPNTETLLFVYYSGHADAQALRLGDSKLPFKELAQLVRGSSAKFRLLVVDACRSGALTRVKGGRQVAPFALPTPSLRGEGMAFLTASSENEDAQESDELKGSFFTHALVSGLLGAADRNRNGEVVLEEAYAHAYDATIRATSRTFAGTQHPTFQYEVRGQGALVLTRPGAAGARRARLSFPPGIDFLVLADTQHGAVLGEVGARDAARTLSLRPGQFFVRGRGGGYLLEGTLRVNAGELKQVATAALTRVEYARLVRKGASNRSAAHGLELGASIRTALPNAETACWGAVGGYRLDLEDLGLSLRLGACASSFDNQLIKADNREYSISMGVDHTWDYSWISLTAGLGAGAALVHQTFQTRGVAPSRLAVAPVGHASLALTRTIARRFYLALDMRLEGYLLKFQESATQEVNLRADTALRVAPLVGMQL